LLCNFAAENERRIGKPGPGPLTNLSSCENESSNDSGGERTTPSKEGMVVGKV